VCFDVTWLEEGGVERGHEVFNLQSGLDCCYVMKDV
jgi:hypothetical protein